MKPFAQGVLGEMRAANYVKKQGMRVLERRYRASHGEIDLIAQDGDTLVFIEVKARPTGTLGAGAQAVNGEKRRHLRFAAQQYLQSHSAGQVRFDVIEITASGLRHIKNAF